MSTETKFKLLVVFSLVCLTGLLAQSYFLWRMDRKLVSLQDDQSSLPTSIEERLEAAMKQPDSIQSGPGVWFGQSAAVDPFVSMQQQMDSLFNAFSRPHLSPFGSISIASQAPEIDIRELESEFQVHIKTPPEHELELNTNLEENRMTVSGVIKKEAVDVANGFNGSVVSQSQFSRTFELPEPVDELGLFMEATDSGLVIKIPKENS